MRILRLWEKGLLYFGSEYCGVDGFHQHGKSKTYHGWDD